MKQITCVALPLLLAIACLINASGQEKPGEVVGSGSRPAVAADSGGKIYITFISEGRLMLSVSEDDNGTFSRPEQVSNLWAKPPYWFIQGGPRIVVSGEDVFIVVAGSTDRKDVMAKKPAVRLYFLKSSDGGKTFSSPKVIAGPYDYGTLYSMSLTNDGGLHVVWLGGSEKQGTKNLLYTSIDTKSMRVGRPVVAAKYACDCCRPVISTGQFGEIKMVVYRDKSSLDLDIRAAYTDYEKDKFVNVSTINEKPTNDKGCPQESPAVANGSTGWITWADRRRGDADVYIQFGPKTGGSDVIMENVMVNTYKNGDQRHPSIAEDLEKNYYVVWEDTRYGYSAIFYKNQGMEKEIKISTRGEGECYCPEIVYGKGVIAIAYESEGNRGIPKKGGARDIVVKIRPVKEGSK